MPSRSMKATGLAMTPAVSPSALGHSPIEFELYLGLVLASGSLQHCFPLTRESSPDRFSSEPTHLSHPSSPSHMVPMQLNYIHCKHLPC